MRRVLRVLLIGLMVFAMPLQGMAASAMGWCGPGHHHMVEGSAANTLQVAISQSEHVHGHVDGHGHGRDHDRDHGPRHPATHHDAHDHESLDHGVKADAGAAHSPGSSSHPGHSSCSACAACCAAVALPASGLWAEASSPMRAVPLYPLVRFASHQPYRLDRPPRTVIA